MWLINALCIYDQMVMDEQVLLKLQNGDSVKLGLQSCL